MSKTLEIITIPHPTLRQTAARIERVDKKLVEFIENLQTTLDQTNRPKGVGLAANQVNKLWRIFATNVSGELRHFINPEIAATSRDISLGENPDDPDLEGCLSIPGVYGPVPRWQWVELKYQLVEQDQLIDCTERFEMFPARVIQHELDHLNGVLFTDHILQYELPLYRQGEDGRGMVEIDRSLITGI